MDTPTAASAPPARETRTYASYLGVLAATLSVAAGAIHLGYAPHHLSEDWAHGWFFVVVGALQLAFGVLVVARPRPWLWRVGLVLNVLVVVTWAVSRSSGLAFGPEALRKEEVGAPDLICTILESGIVVIAAVVLAFAKELSRPVRDRLSAVFTVTALSSLAVIVSAVMLTPSYVDAHESTDHTHADGTTADGHTHASTVALDGSTPCEQAGPAASPGQVATDTEGHSHRGPSPQQPLTEDQRQALQTEQAEARQAALRFPTVADAEAAGYTMSVAYVPCIGAHYTNTRLARSFDPARPSELLFDGTDPDSRIVGLSYLVYSGDTAPDGFTGPNDVWHQHNFNGGLCMSGGQVIGSEQLSASDCEAIGGAKVSLNGVWMLHDWVVPGWECSWGAFAGECPELGGRTGGTAWDAPDPASAAADPLSAIDGG